LMMAVTSFIVAPIPVSDARQNVFFT